MKKLTKAVFIAILLIQTCIFAFMGNLKLGYHMDEIYSYGLANSYEYQWAVIDEGKEYQPHEIFSDYVNVNETHKFDYSIDWRNQALDVHPPLFYVLLHTICIIFNLDFSKWPGIVLNIFIALFLSFGVLKLSQKYTEDDNKALAVTAINAFSMGMCNMVMYIRMYALLTTWTVWFVYLIYSAIKEKREFNKEFAVKYIVILTMGVMTQYYFLIFAFFVCLIFAVILILRKQYEKLKKIIIYSGISGILCVVIFPFMLKHLVGGKRGRDSFTALFDLDHWISNIATMSSQVSRQLFLNGITAFIIAIICVVILVLIHIKFKEITGDNMYIFTIAALLFYLMISKIAPFATDRYVFCIYPVIMISTVGFILKHADKITSIRSSSLVSALVIIMFILTIVSYRVNPVPYLFRENKERWDYADEYKHIPCLYVYDAESCDAYWDFPQIREYDSLKFVREVNIDKLADMQMDNYDEVVVYIIKSLDNDSVLSSVLEQNRNLSSEKLIYSSNGADVYYCN